MTASRTGMVVGGVFGIVWVFANFWWAVLVLALIGVGLVIGRIIDGKLDVSTLVAAVSGRGSSS